MENYDAIDKLVIYFFDEFDYTLDQTEILMLISIYWTARHNGLRTVSMYSMFYDYLRTLSIAMSEHDFNEITDLLADDFIKQTGTLNSLLSQS